MKRLHIISKYIKIFLMIIFFEIRLLNSSDLSLDEIKTALKEVAYSYYLRGKTIQYSVSKSDYFPPEDATSQNINHLCCTQFVQSVFRELLNITVPNALRDLLDYSRDNLGCPEVIAYSTINIKTNNLEMRFYNSSSNTNYTTKINPSLNDIFPILQIGDILTYDLHTLLIYDLIKDNNGKIIDALLIESGYGIGESWVNSKISRAIKLPNGENFGTKNHFLFFNSKVNNDYEEGLEQGTVQLFKLSEKPHWVAINDTQKRRSEYSILRFIQNNSSGIPILTYKTIRPYYPNKILNNQPIVLPDNSFDRLKKFNHIYIEKTVDKFNDNIVEIGDTLKYTIIVRNKGKKNYKENIIITEYLSEFVKYEMYYINNTNIVFKPDLNNRKLIWDIGKLKKDEEISIDYSVKIINGTSGDAIESLGFVGNIPSSKIKNILGVNLDKNKMKVIEENYEKLKKKYNGKKLINEIYKEAFDFDMKFDEFDITKLVINNNLTCPYYYSLELNKTNLFYSSILNKYWASLLIQKYGTLGGKNLYVYDTKYYRKFIKEDRRQDHIYPNTFRTGDILIYKNKNDATYSKDKNNNLILNYVTYEEGEYSYIYIEGKGFVGVNLGDDGIPNTKDDRNEFNAKYYSDNKLELYILYNNPDSEILENANYQTLFGKDYYVILRPSLSFNFQINNNKNSNIVLGIILSVIIASIILIILIVYFRRKNKKKKSLENNSINLPLF